MAKLFVITGPSGVGKGTLIGELLRRVPELELSVSVTTRAPREGEEDGCDYRFVSPEEFERLAEEGAFVEWATYSGNRYGTLRSEAEGRLARGISVVLEIEVQGAGQVRQAMAESVQVFIEPPGVESLRERLEGRGLDSGEAIEQRLRTAEMELQAKDDFKYRVLNDDVERAVSDLERIVRAELSGQGPG